MTRIYVEWITARPDPSYYVVYRDIISAQEMQGMVGMVYYVGVGMKGVGSQLTLPMEPFKSV